MMKSIVISLVLFMVAGLVGVLSINIVAGAAPAIFADSQSLACDGATLVTGGDCDNIKGSAVSDIVQSIISIFAWGLGILAVIFIMYGGFKYVTSGGDSSKVTSARNTILFAIIGLVIAAVAQPLVNYVIGLFTV